MPSCLTRSDPIEPGSSPHLPTPQRFLIAIGQLPFLFERIGARGLIHYGLGYRITLGVISCRLEWRDEFGDWWILDAPFFVRQRIACIAEAVLKERLTLNCERN